MQNIWYDILRYLFPGPTVVLAASCAQKAVRLLEEDIHRVEIGQVRLLEGSSLQTQNIMPDISNVCRSLHKRYTKYWQVQEKMIERCE